MTTDKSRFNTLPTQGRETAGSRRPEKGRIGQESCLPDVADQPASRLYLRPELEERVHLMAGRGYPEETCGLLIGHQAAAEVWVVELVQARNLNRERAVDRFELDPQDLLAADLKARNQGLEIVGIWHSHPDHPARPSATDRAGAWAGWSYLIVSVSREGVRELRSWRLHQGDFTEEVVEWTLS